MRCATLWVECRQSILDQKNYSCNQHSYDSNANRGVGYIMFLN